MNKIRTKSIMRYLLTLICFFVFSCKSEKEKRKLAIKNTYELYQATSDYGDAIIDQMYLKNADTVALNKKLDSVKVFKDSVLHALDSLRKLDDLK